MHAAARPASRWVGDAEASLRLVCRVLLFIGLSGAVADAQPVGAEAKPNFSALRTQGDDFGADSGGQAGRSKRQRPAAVILGDGDAALPSVRGTRFSMDGRSLAIWGAPANPADGRSIDIWDIKSRRRRWRLVGHDHPVRAVMFVRDGKMLVSAAFRESDASGDVRCWDLTTGQELWRSPRGGVDLRPPISGRGVRVLVGDQVRVLRLDTGAEVGRFVAGPAVGLRLADRDQISLGLNQQRALAIRLFDYRRQQEFSRLSLDAMTPRSVVISPNGRTVAAVASETIVMWEVVTGAELGRLSGHTGRVLTLTFSRNGRWLASAGLDGTVRLWDVTRRVSIASFPAHTRGVTCLDFHAAETHLASGGLDRLVRIWDLNEHLPSTNPVESEQLIDRDALWTALASGVPSQAYPAIVQAEDHQTVQEFLLEKYKVELLVSGNQRAAALVEQLQDGDFAVRFRATESLKRLLPGVRPFLLKSLESSESDEVRYRLRRILKGTEGLPRFSAGEIRRVRRVISLLRGAAGPTAKELLQLIAARFPDSKIAGQARAASLGAAAN